MFANGISVQPARPIWPDHHPQMQFMTEAEFNVEAAHTESAKKTTSDWTLACIRRHLI